MTGFGSTELSTKFFKMIVEIKTLNHRYFDISYYLPSGFGFVENKIRQMVQKYIERGRITVSVKFIQKNSHTISLNKEILKKHIQYAHAISREFGIKNDLVLSDFVKLPGVLEAKEIALVPEDEWNNLEKCLSKALDGLNKMRESEGRSLTVDVKKNLNDMLLQIKNIQARGKMAHAGGRWTIS